MTDRVYPQTKPAAAAAAATTTQPQTLNGTAATTKPQLYNPTRQPYRPPPRHHRRSSRRTCTCCCCCFWSILLLLLLALVAAIAGAALWVLYRPHRPTFSISSLKFSRFNLTTTADSSSSHLTTSLNVSLSSRNPNKKLTFFYDPITISILSNDDVLLANGSIPSFTSTPQNLTNIKSTLSASRDLDTESVTALRSDLKKKNGLPLKLQLDTKVKVKIDGLKTKKVGIRVTCDEIHGVVPTGKSSSVATVSNSKCKVDLRIKIWKWTF